MAITSRALFPAIKATLADQRIVVITGMRRVGKTTTLRWLLEQSPTQNKIYLDLERLDQRAVFQESNYDNVLNFLRSRGLNPAQPMIVALDEIQYVPNLPSVVKYLYDHYGIKFLLTGSSSYYLKHLFTESLAGRKIVFEMYPLCFGEFLDFRGVAHQRASEQTEAANLTTMRYVPYEYARLKSYYDEYMQYGGMPDVVLESKASIRTEILKDVMNSYINIDVRAISDLRKIGELQQLLKVLAMRIGNKLDATKLSQIIGISRPTLAEYLDLLEKTYVIYRLPAYSSPDKAVALGKKLYFCDNGIANTFVANPGEGALFENAVHNQLRTYGELAYLAKGNDYEVDFVLTRPGQQPVGLEVKYHPVAADAAKLKRIGAKHELAETWLVGCHPTPGFDEFLWGGLIF